MAGVARGAAEQITAKQQVQGVYNTQTSIINISYYLIYWQYYCMVPGTSRVYAETNKDSKCTFVNLSAVHCKEHSDNECYTALYRPILVHIYCQK